jgi:hypothetical protein
MPAIEREWFPLDMATIVLWNVGLSTTADIARLTNQSENTVHRTITAYGRDGRNPRTGERVVDYVRGSYEPKGMMPYHNPEVVGGRMIGMTDIDIDEIESDIADSPEYWAAVRESAEEILVSVKPRSAKARLARQHLAEYEEWKRTYLVPKKWKSGNWTTTKKGGYCIKAPKSAQVGDSCLVTYKSGEKKWFRLTEKHGEGLFTGEVIDTGAA